MADDADIKPQSGGFRWITPNSLPVMFEKYSKPYLQEYISRKGMKRKAQYRLYQEIVSEYLSLIFDVLIEDGQDVVTKAGTFCVRQVQSPNWLAGGWSRDFTLLGGKKYGIHDFMKRGNCYPTIYFRPTGSVAFRNVMWRFYLKVKYRYRRRLYEAFYDRGKEYKQVKWEFMKKRAAKNRTIWRNERLVKIKQ